MSDLFELPESPLPPLEAARRRLAKAVLAYGDAPSDEKELLRDELISAEFAVEKLEQEALRK